ncbi:MAG: hypothetical protein AB8B95_00275 [Pseudohongiellaceae bacterium]
MLKIFLKRPLCVLVFSLVFSPASQAQWAPLVTNYYDTVSETLRLPNVFVLPIPGESSGFENFYNLEFHSKGNNIFELVSLDELQPEQECTRAEVLAAIPQLRLDTTIEEVSTLIGCETRVTRANVDLTSGILANATVRRF